MASLVTLIFPKSLTHITRYSKWTHKIINPSFAQCANSSRLQQRNFCSKSSIIDIEKIRNIGIIAHIDAGKTTTTERMLYYSGITDSIGEVHEGDTVTDYLEQERQRGITITSAAVTFPWKKHRINLIDTPGHVDFTVEVERSLSVLDSAVVVLDASAGVEAQTITVWSQADRHKVPRIVYLNKMDKATADVDMCLNSIRKLGQTPVQIHLPLFDTSQGEKRLFYGFIDLISMNQFKWAPSEGSDGTEFQVTPLEKTSQLYEEASAHREELASAIAEFDETLSERVLSVPSIDQITANELMLALRRRTIGHKVIPVVCGSSYKNIGVQKVLDAIISLLPSPKDLVKQHTPFYEGHLCALAFKVIHHKMLGPLTFVRLYTGEIKSNTSVYNVNRDRKEKVAKVYVALADEFKEVTAITAGNIVAISGLDCITGDTLVSSSAAVSQARERMRERMLHVNRSTEKEERARDQLSPILAGPVVPDPVFFCTIEAPSPSQQSNLENALTKLQREDPSLKVDIHESGQIILSGMGELHLDVVKDRLRTEHSVEAYMGPLQVSYKEGIRETVTKDTSVTKFIAGTKNSCSIVLTLQPVQGEEVTDSFPLKVVPTSHNDLGTLRIDRLKAIENGISQALMHGPLLSFPVIGVQPSLIDFKATYVTSPAFVSMVASQCVKQALKEASITLLEPMMKLDIRVPVNYSTRIISDLSSRRSQLGSVSERNSIRIIEALTPLSELVNYATVLRTISSGTASFTIVFSHYIHMTESEKKEAINKITKF